MIPDKVDVTVLTPVRESVQGYRAPLIEMMRFKKNIKQEQLDQIFGGRIEALLR